MNSYIKLGIVALLPVIISVIFYLLDRKTNLGKIDIRIKQGLWGVVFGLLAILGTEWSIPLEGAVLNCRDASVITAGLLFGAQAGVIAGLMGGIERWIAVAWGVGYYTRVACSVSTVLAGIYAALLRKYMFENKKPGWLLSAAVGTVMEVFHLMMVFFTNMDTPNQAMAIIRVCAIPMIVANGLSVMLSAMAVSLLSGKKNEFPSGWKNHVRISQTIQKWLLIAVAAAFAASSLFIYELQNQLANAQGDKLLTMALDEIEADIRDASNENLLKIAQNLTKELGTDSTDLAAIAQEYGIAEINIVDGRGVIISSTERSFIGYDMRSGEQSAAFLCLLDGQKTYVQDYGPISYNSAISRKYAGIQYGYGFIQVGYDAAQFQRDIDEDIIGITKNRHVGQTGFILIINEHYDVVSAPENLSLSTLREEISQVELPGADVTFPASLNGQRFWVRYRSVEGYHLVSFLPEEEVLHMRDMALYVNSFMEVIIFAVLFGLIYMLIKHVVVDQIKQFNVSLKKIAGGNLNEAVNVRSNEEFASLSDDINTTVNTLKHYIDEASKRLDQELEFAKTIQRSALPNVFPAFPKRKDLDIYASMDPAKEVGGDFYDFYMTQTDTLNFLVADVSGKGIPAALFMMRAKTELKSLTEAELNLADVFTRSNTNLCEGNDAGMFVTVWQGCINLTTGVVQYANAGHNPPVIRHGNGSFEFLKSKAGFVLAGIEGFRYEMQELQMEPGDILYLYTDGVTEATNSELELYGNDRLLDVLNRANYTSMQELCACVKADLDAFVGEAPQFDDITMVAFRYIGQPTVPSIHFDQAILQDITATTEFVEQELERMGCPPKAAIQLSIAIDEIFSNIIHYGYGEKPGPVTVEVMEQAEPRAVCLRFTDEGIPYNPLTAAEPDVVRAAAEDSVGGLGIYMVKNTMDDMRYQYENGRNILTIQKNF